MKLRKVTLDNSVNYISSVKSSPSENSHDHKPKTASNPGKQNKKISSNQNSLKT